MLLSFVSQHRSSSWTLSVLSCLAILTSYSVGAADNGLTDFSAAWQPVIPLPGVEPLFGYQEKTVDKRQTECSANGSNYCFADNTVDYCGSCGYCCRSGSSKYCCGMDQICCGGACCASGQTCQTGQCFAARGTMIVTHVTVSHTATRVVTVVKAVVQTSTIFSTTSVTVSNEATQTDTEYVTVTAAVLKRDQVVVILEVRQSDQGPGLRDTLSHFYKRFSLPWSDTEGLQRRDEIAPGDLGTPVPPRGGITKTTSITRTSDVTRFIPTTTTVPTTSVVLTTIIQTKTVVLNAQTTVTTTSTLTVTYRPPTTITQTQTETLPTDPASSTTDPSSSPSSTSTGTSSSPSTKSSSLSTGAIAGIAGGIGGAALLALLALLAFCLRRRRSRPPPHQDPSSYLEPYEPDMSAPLPPQNRTSGSGLDRFSPSAPHHGTSPPPVAGALGSKPITDRYANMKPTDRYSSISSHTATTSRDGAISPRLPDMAEVPGQEREVYEADSHPAVPKAAEMDGTSAPRAAEMDGTDHHPGASEMDGTGRHPTGAELDGHETISPVSPPQRYANYSPAHMEEMEGDDDGSPNTLRNSNAYRQPGAYRDF